jgi:hypothetical protein
MLRPLDVHGLQGVRSLQRFIQTQGESFAHGSEKRGERERGGGCLVELLGCIIGTRVFISTGRDNASARSDIYRYLLHRAS